MGPPRSFSAKSETEAVAGTTGYLSSGLHRIEHQPIYRVGLAVLIGLFAGVWK